MKNKESKKIFRYVEINGKRYEINKVGKSIQIPQIVNGELKGRIKVL